MSEFDEIKNLRDKLNAFQSESPGFDELFGDIVPGEARLNNLFQSKLQNHTAPAPSYEELILGNTTRIIPFIRRRSPIWGVAAAAAACIAFFFLLPDITKMDDAGISLVNENAKKEVNNRHIYKTLRPEAKFKTIALATPIKIKKISLSDNEKMKSGNDSGSSADSAGRDDLSKITGSVYTALSVDNGYNMEQIYEQARQRKKNQKKFKLKAGINVNGGNSLLSFVNTKQSGDFALRSTFDNYSQGLSTLAASSTPKVNNVLRAATVSENAWLEPENITSSISTYKENYSLPVNFGLSVSIPLLKIMELQTGINYTYLSGVTSGTINGSEFNLHRELHYLGIPVKLSINFHEQGKFGMYASFGGSIEKGLVGKQLSHVDGSEDWESSQSVNGIQPIVGVQLGASYEIVPSVLLYVEPGANYYFASDQPISSRTEEPFNFNIGFGLRYKFK